MKSKVVSDKDENQVQLLCVKLAAAAIVGGPLETLRHRARLALVVEQTISRWVKAEMRNCASAPRW
jgi:hypothetical protein